MMRTETQIRQFTLTEPALNEALQSLSDEGWDIASVQSLPNFRWLVLISRQRMEATRPSAKSRFKRDDAYALEGHYLQKLETVARRLDDPKTLTFDDRRDLANLMNLILSDTTRMERHDDEH